ncbi:hypothetical protein BDP27DRAFT_1484412 [Rhodocollybia butyracea]|uniref:Uncharacterized protein n=1 Tax=Rhodocollybia butyracea TaxID=206335 RepID=A0A9P5U120_9AGAR|nr:hypothetical protein BDP27DRAFT_1484412 [Rhodocollybia butyracea]
MDVALVKQIIVEIAVGMASWGINTALLFFTVYTLISRGILVSRPRQVLLAIISCMYIGACVSEVVYILKFLVIINNLDGSSPPPITLGPRSEQIWEAIFTGTNYLLSDGVVCWRAWVLYPHNKAAKFLLVICMLGSICVYQFFHFILACWGTEILYDEAAVATGFAIGTNLRLVDFDASPTALSNLIYYVPLLLTNVVATILVGAKFWSILSCFHIYRALMRRLLQGISQRNLYPPLFWGTETDLGGQPYSDITY